MWCIVGADSWGSSLWAIWYYDKPVKSMDYDPHFTGELMGGGLEKLKCPQATGRAGICGHLQWQWCLCFHLLSQTMSHSLWQVGHCITLPRLSEGNSHISKSGTLIHPLWPGLEMGKNSVWEVCIELWRDKTVSFFGLNVTWDFILSLLLGPRIWPGLSPDPYTMSCDMACFYCWS